MACSQRHSTSFLRSRCRDGGIIGRKPATLHCCTSRRDRALIHRTRTSKEEVSLAKGCADGQESQAPISKRALLASCGAMFLGTSSCRGALAATSDPVEGTANLIDIGAKWYTVWFQSMLDDLQNGTNTAPDDDYRRKRFGIIKIPGLSSFSFIHGLLVGVVVIVLLLADRLGPQQTQQQNQPATVSSEEGSVNPQVEAALKKFISTPEVSETFHDPEVHKALMEIRADLKNISKYKDNPRVIQAFEKLLDIENILEQL